MTGQSSKPLGLRKRLYGVLRAVVPVGLLAYVANVLRSQWATAGPLPEPALGWLAASLAALVVYYATVVENWRAVMAALGTPLERPRAFRILFVSNLAKFLPGGVWNLVGRVAMCKADGIPVATATLSLLIEVTAQVAAMAVVTLIGLSSAVDHLIPFSRWYLLPAPLLVIAGTHPTLINGMLGVLERLTKRDLPRMDISYLTMLLVLGRFLFTWCLLSASFAMLGRALAGPAAGTLDAALLHAGAISLSWLAGLFAFVVPGGLGVREVLLTSLLGVAYPAVIAAAVALAFRLILVVVELAGFGVAMLLRKR